jgi:hypothetical protein
VLGQVRLLGLGARYPRCEATCSRRSRGRSGRRSSTPSGSARRSTRARWGCDLTRRGVGRSRHPSADRGYYRGPQPPAKGTVRFPCCVPVSRWLVALAALAARRSALRALNYEPVYRVSEIVVEYALDSPQQIPLDEVLDLEIGLRRAEDAYVAPRPVDRTVRMRLSALPRDASFGASAILHINQYDRRRVQPARLQRRDRVGARHRGGHGPRPARARRDRAAAADLDRPGVARREHRRRRALRRALRRRAHQPPEHAWIREHSPVRPGGPRGLLSVSALETTRPRSRAIPAAA